MSRIVAWLVAALGATALTVAAVVAVGDRPSAGSPPAAAETAVPVEDESAGGGADVPVFTGNLLVVGGAEVREALSTSFASAGLHGQVLTVAPTSALTEAAVEGAANAVLIDAAQPSIDWGAVAGFVAEGRLVYAINTDLAHLSRAVWGALEAKGLTAAELGVEAAPEGDQVAIPGASAYIVASDACLRVLNLTPAAGLDFGSIVITLGAAQHCAASQVKPEAGQ